MVQQDSHKGSSRNASTTHKTVLSMAQYSRNLFPANPGKPFQEIVNAGTVLEVLKERFDGHTSPSENPGSTHAVRFSFDLGTFVPEHLGD